MDWGSFRPDEIEALATGVSFLVEPGERDCPACGVRRLRAYVQSPPQAKRPTLVSYVWCAGCRKFAGSRARRPDGLVFADPLAGLGLDRGRLTDFLAHLDRLWDDGVLPQSFAVA
jgi:hypothetical protein